MVEAFRRNLPGTPVVCESVTESSFFGLTYSGVVAWGLMFLLQPGEQRGLIEAVSRILEPGGRLLFTSPYDALVWNDVMTGQESRSLGAGEYRRLLAVAGLDVVSEYEDAGQNCYFDVRRPA